MNYFIWAWIAASTTNHHLKGCLLHTESGRSGRSNDGQIATPSGHIHFKVMIFPFMSQRYSDKAISKKRSTNRQRFLDQAKESMEIEIGRAHV